MYQTIEGAVAKANGKGFILEGRDGWLNISRYAEPSPPMPPEGAYVRVGVDKSGYARTVEVISGDTPQNVATRAEMDEKPPVSRDTSITRMATLNTAVSILASAGRPADVDGVIAVAARLEAWVTR